MYLPFYWEVSKLAFASLMLSSWQFLSTGILSTRQAALVTGDLSKKGGFRLPLLTEIFHLLIVNICLQAVGYLKKSGQPCTSEALQSAAHLLQRV